MDDTDYEDLDPRDAFDEDDESSSPESPLLESPLLKPGSSSRKRNQVKRACGRGSSLIHSALSKGMQEMR